MLEGRKFTVRTDDEPLSLTHTIPRVSDPWTARQCRHLAFMAEYISNIQHIASSKYIVADRLSQPSGHMRGPHAQLCIHLVANVLEIARGLHLHTADWDHIHWNLQVELWQVLWLQCLHSFSASWCRTACSSHCRIDKLSSCPAKGGTPWNSCHAMNGVGTLSVEWPGQRYRQLVPLLPHGTSVG
jgi:hypothetical protein